MEMHKNPNAKKNSLHGDVMTLKEPHRNGSTYGAFQSKDPILAMEKASEIEDRSEHGISVHHPTSYLETMMHLFKGNVGSGIFALGDAFKHAGLLLAPPLTMFLGIICVHAQHILIKCNEEVTRRVNDPNATTGFAGTVELCFATGPLSLRKYSVFMRKLVNIFLCITQLGFCCVYFVFIAKNMKLVMDVYGIEMDVHQHMAVILIPIMLSTWIRNLKYLVPVSSMANFLVIAGYIATMYIMCNDLPSIHERRYIADWHDLPLFFGTVIYSFEGITLVLPLKNEMKKPSNFSKPLGVLNVGMVIVGGMFVAMGFISYLKYGDAVAGSVTLNLESKEVLKALTEGNLDPSLILKLEEEKRQQQREEELLKIKEKHLLALLTRENAFIAKKLLLNDIKAHAETVRKEVDWIMLSTSTANRFVRYDYLHDYDISNLKFAVIGGSALNRESQDIIKKYLSNTMIIQAYGMTELGGIITIQSSNATSGSCGIVIPNCQIKIIDTETGKTLGPNQTGELCAKTWTMMTGYYKNPEATKDIFDKNGWLHSGDLAYYNEIGEIFIVDRLKEIIKYKGYQISPNKIENLLQSHPAVLEVGVVGIPHSIYDELPIAFISKIPNKEVSEEELSKMVANNMMDIYKLRGGIKFLPSLPHTPSGKISRKKLRAMAKELIIN